MKWKQRQDKKEIQFLLDRDSLNILETNQFDNDSVCFYLFTSNMKKGRRRDESKFINAEKKKQNFLNTDRFVRAELVGGAYDHQGAITWECLWTDPLNIEEVESAALKKKLYNRR